MSNKVRLQFDFTPDALKRVDEMQRKLDVPTRSEVIRSSLKIYEWFIQLDPEQVIEVQEHDGTVVYRIPVKTLLS